MKINNINFFNYNSIKSPIFKAQDTTSQSFSSEQSTNTQMNLDPAEMLGRSQVNFTGRDFHFSEGDQKFINVVAKNIRMSDDEKKQLEDAVSDYLTDNKYKSLDDISGDENSEIQGEFIEKVGYKLRFLSDMDFNMFADELIERTSQDGDDYDPKPDKYRKDFEVVDHILEQYEMSEDKKTEIFDVLKMEAEHNEYDTVFDIFRINPDRPIYLFGKYLNFDKSTLSDLLIDFGYAATLDAKTRHAQINPNKLTAKTNQDYKDSAIADEFIQEFGLNEDEEEYIKAQLQKRREGVKPEKIAYDLIETYNLGLEEFQYMLGTIYNFDTCFYNENEDDESLN